MKMKSLEGIARKHGRDAFLNAAGYYTCHVKDTVTDTIFEMQSRWYDRMGGQLESEAMINDYNSGNCILSARPDYSCIDMGQLDAILDR